MRLRFSVPSLSLSPTAQVHEIDSEVLLQLQKTDLRVSATATATVVSLKPSFVNPHFPR